MVSSTSVNSGTASAVNGTFSAVLKLVSRYFTLLRVGTLAQVGAEFEDHGGAQEAQEADSGNITSLKKR